MMIAPNYHKGYQEEEEQGYQRKGRQKEIATGRSHVSFSVRDV